MLREGLLTGRVIKSLKKCLSKRMSIISIVENFEILIFVG